MRRMLLAGLVLLGAPAALPAQAPQLILPKTSPRATVSQTVGLTDISVTYDRPGVNGRPIWGALVPWDSVWRAGANENTVIAFSSPVRVGDTDVPAGRYGLHMIPSRSAWTVILSHQANAWGSFSYDPAEDLLRVKVTPVKGDFHERLVYTLDDPGQGTVMATLRWDTLAVPLPIQVDTRRVVADSLREQLRGLARFFWQPWNQAAAWCAANGTNLREATAWADRSIAINENFTNLRVKAALLDKQGDVAGAKALLERSLVVATEADMNTFGYLLMGQDKIDSAVMVFQKNVKDYPKSWNAYDSLGEAYAKKGDVQRAIHAYTQARKIVRDPAQQQRIDGILAGLQHPT